MPKFVHFHPVINFLQRSAFWDLAGRFFCVSEHPKVCAFIAQKLNKLGRPFFIFPDNFCHSIRIRKEKYPIWRPRYSCQNFIPMGLVGPRMAHSKIWTSPLRFLKNLGKTFLGVGRPGGLAPKFKGSPRTRYGGIIGGPLGVQNTVGTGALGQTLGTEVSRKSENFEILGSGSVLGAL